MNNEHTILLFHGTTISCLCSRTFACLFVGVLQLKPDVCPMLGEKVPHTTISPTPVHRPAIIVHTSAVLVLIPAVSAAARPESTQREVN